MVITDTLARVAVDGDDIIFDHVYNATQELKNAAEFRKNNDGNWTDQRDMRLIGSIPALVWEKLAKEKPEIVKDARKLKAWLYETEEGKLWRTNTGLLTGKSAQCIVK